MVRRRKHCRGTRSVLETCFLATGHLERENRHMPQLSREVERESHAQFTASLRLAGWVWGARAGPWLLRGPRAPCAVSSVWWTCQEVTELETRGNERIFSRTMHFRDVLVVRSARARPHLPFVVAALHAVNHPLRGRGAMLLSS